MDKHGSYVLKGSDYAGYTVDALLKEDKLEEARSELERLVLEGLDSGPGIEVTPESWDEFWAEIRQRAQDLPSHLH